MPEISFNHSPAQQLFLQSTIKSNSISMWEVKNRLVNYLLVSLPDWYVGVKQMFKNISWKIFSHEMSNELHKSWCLQKIWKIILLMMKILWILWKLWWIINECKKFLVLQESLKISIEFCSAIFAFRSMFQKLFSHRCCSFQIKQKIKRNKNLLTQLYSWFSLLSYKKKLLWTFSIKKCTFISIWLFRSSTILPFQQLSSLLLTFSWNETTRLSQPIQLKILNYRKRWENELW